MKKWQAVLFALLAAIVSAAVSDAKQEQPAVGDRRGNRCFNGKMWTECGQPEKPEPQPYITRKWQVARIEGDFGWTDVRVDAIDTAGVCLFIARGYTKDVISIAAVPKGQLPPGTGCQ